MITFEQAVKRINDLKIDDAYQVDKLTDFQYRINGKLDIFLNARPNKLFKYHYIPTDERENFQRNEIYKILNKFFT